MLFPISSSVSPTKNRHIVDRLTIVGRNPGVVPFVVNLPVSPSANAIEVRNSSNVVLVSIRESASTGFVGARRFEFSDDPTNRYIMSYLWQNNNAIAISAPTISMWGGSDTQQFWLFASAGLLCGQVFGLGSQNYTIRGFDQDAVGGRGFCSLTLRGGNASQTNTGGGNLILNAGAGTGTGLPGAVQLQAATVLGSGTTLQTLATVLTITNSTTITYAEAVNSVYGTATGTKHGTATTQKQAFWNAAPIIQPANANQAAVTDSTTGTPSFTLVDVGVVFSQANENNNFASLARQLNEIRNVLVNTGLMKGSA